MNPPSCYEIIEKGKKVSFAIPENALHIHDTNNVYHRAVIPKGWDRWIYILHFTKKPCLPGNKRNGYSASLIGRNVIMRSYVELFIENRGQIFIAFVMIMIMLKLYRDNLS